GLRVRPVMMTVLPVIIGLIPIMYGEGTGSEVMQRIAAPMIGGMASALLLTLLVLPAIFKLWKQRELCPNNSTPSQTSTQTGNQIENADSTDRAGNKA
ncbi:efflux RND transporter permease subunit, partial [Vibrio owensii]